jgi:transcriptional regulator with XRE-family HTH domain
VNAHSVLRVGWSADAYRSAVATIIRDIQRHERNSEGKPLSLLEIADSIDVSLGTVSNAVNEKTGLSAEYLARLGAVYGGAYLNPYLALFNSQAQPLPPKPTTDILPVIARANLKIAEARDPSGPGGATEVPQERRGYLHDLKTLQREVGCLIREIECV